MTARRQRTPAEWVTFAVAVLILSALIGTIVVEARQSDEPPRPVAFVERSDRVAGRYQVTVEVRNEGDLAAAAVQVVASLEVDGDTTEADQVIDFLAGGGDETLVFFFADNPDDGEFTVEVTGFTVP